MNRFRISCFVTIVLCSLLFVGVSAVKPASAATQVKPITLSFNCYITPAYFQYQNVKDWMDLVTERAAGRLKFKFFPAGQLLSATATWDGVRERRVDMGYIYGGYVSGNDPYFGFWDANTFSFDDFAHAQRALDGGLFALADEACRTNKTHLLSTTLYGYEALHTRDRQIKMTGDLKGLKIRGPSKPGNELVNDLGGVGIFTPSSELYMALQKGTIDGVITSADTAVSRKLYEVLKYTLDIPINIGLGFTFINLDAWNNIPKDLQDLITKASKDVDQKYISLYLKSHKDSMETLAKNGVTITRLTPKELAPWKEASKAVMESWMPTYKQSKKIVEIVEKTRAVK